MIHFSTLYPGRSRHEKDIARETYCSIELKVVMKNVDTYVVFIDISVFNKLDLERFLDWIGKEKSL